MAKAFARVIGGAAAVLAMAASAGAKLAYRADDVYVRQSDVMVVADVVSLGLHGQIPVAQVQVAEVLMGSNVPSTILVRNFPDDREDMPYFRVGERSLLLLKADVPVAGVFWCVGADATKRDLRTYGAKKWASMLERIKALSDVRAISSDRARAEALVGLLESHDIDLAAAASNYLNFLATGEDDEGWIINPPEGSSDWSWDDYYRRNVAAHRTKWRNWWRARQTNP